MRLALVSPHYPPHPGGVSDYLARLALELPSLGAVTGVWTAEASPRATPGVSFQTFPGNWSKTDLHRIEASISGWKAQAVVIQFTPYLYGPESRGLCPGFVFWLRQLHRRLGIPVAVMVHELHYPPGLTPDRLAVGVPQWLQFQLLAAVSDRLWFTNEVALRHIASRFPGKRARMAWLPVGATIEPASPPPPPPQGARPGERILLQFGSGHPSRLFKLSFDALRAAKKGGAGPTRLVFAGMDKSEVAARLEECAATDLASEVAALGYLSETEASAWISRADAVLAPFIDGISTRRTSAMAALAHGRPLVTTLSYSSDPSIDWRAFCLASSDGESQAFAADVVRVLRTPSVAAAFSAKGLEAYQKRFSWPVLARKLLSLLASR